MIWVWLVAVPLAGIVTALPLYLLRRWSLRSAALVPAEPVTDPLHPDWRPVDGYIEPLFYQRATPAPPTWDWPSFTQAWPVLNPAPASATDWDALNDHSEIP